MKRWLYGGIGFLLLLVFDQLTKIWAVVQLKENGPISLIPNVLELYYVENRGAAFGILQNKQWFFLIITILVLGVLLWLITRIPKERHYFALRVCLYFLAAGAVGNMIDRVFRTYVVDFIYFRLINFPVFNVADIFVTVAAAVFLILVLFVYKDEDWEILFPKGNDMK